MVRGWWQWWAVVGAGSGGGIGVVGVVVVDGDARTVLSSCGFVFLIVFLFSSSFLCYYGY